MWKGKFYSKDIFFMSIVLVIFFFAVGAIKIEKELFDKPEVGRADIIYIDTMSKLGDLDRVPVPFFHDRHTDVLHELGYDCTSCHIADGNKLSHKFKRLDDESRELVMSSYHINCIGCHADKSLLSEKSGPVTCGGCHKKSNYNYESSWVSMKFNKNLHFIHVRSNEEKCDLCHHEYDEKKKKLFYKKGIENPCSFCHMKERNQNIAPIREVCHDSCIKCHREKEINLSKGGPIKCSGCHDHSTKKNVKKAQNIPRMDRSQPDATIIKTKASQLDKENNLPSMSLVPFNHKVHERCNDNCSVCHHFSFDPCSGCHFNSNEVGSGQLKLIDAMHAFGNERSCFGCHNLKQKQVECIGCHSSDSNYNKDSDFSCSACHVNFNYNSKSEKESRDIAKKIVNDRVYEVRIDDETEIPKIVSIGILEDQYKPVAFPHYKVILSLLNGVKNSKLALHFHNDNKTICSGCHHNTPISGTPPACVNCHGNTKEVSAPYKPGLVGAYHQQCIGCHELMCIEKPNSKNCNACHEKKDSSR